MEFQTPPAAGIPLSTYRLQFNHLFPFSRAKELVPYLHELGISTVYASPIFKARRGSLHGYDIVDPTRLNPELGTEADFLSLIDELHRFGMGLILDIVPNHMACDPNNDWWMDLLANGRESSYSDFFAIHWHEDNHAEAEQLILPFLGAPYGKALENQELVLCLEKGSFFIWYHDLKFPLLPESYASLLEFRVESFPSLATADKPEIAELLSIAYAFRNLPRTGNAGGTFSEREREVTIAKKRLETLHDQSSEVRKILDDNIWIYNGFKGTSYSFNLLDELIGEQNWKLLSWQTAGDEINYRRFFDISDLVAIRMEDARVFHTTHALIFKLIEERKLCGLRIDHPDGLYNPAQYFDRLQYECFSRLATSVCTLAGSLHRHLERELLRPSYRNLLVTDPCYNPFYLVVEKILADEERIPEDWPVCGTTGYDYLNQLNGLFIDGEQEDQFSSLYRTFTGKEQNFEKIGYESRKLFMEASFSAELERLGRQLALIASKERHGVDFTQRNLTAAIGEVIACFPIYRTYISSGNLEKRDQGYIEIAIDRARNLNVLPVPEIFDFLLDILLLRFSRQTNEDQKRRWFDFVMNFQQVTAPVMAKGIEDRALYVYNRLISLNEVGGNPARFGLSPDKFHVWNKDRQKLSPFSLSATSTHDTKRSEDARARINVLSEIPETWEAYLKKWSQANDDKKVSFQGEPVPDRNEEYFLYQTLLGVWPSPDPDRQEYLVFIERIKEYMRKALREAKVHTSWLSRNSAYEGGVTSFIETILHDNQENCFLQDFKQFQKEISFFGMVNSLAQTLLKILSPGIPDFFQGTELWDFSLVDPDNRRTVDYGIRRELLAHITKERTRPEHHRFMNNLLEDWQKGAIKLYLTYHALQYRRQHPALFLDGSYEHLFCTGELKDHIISFARCLNGHALLVIVPRLMMKVLRHDPRSITSKKLWGKTSLILPEKLHHGSLRNVLTEEVLTLNRSAGKENLPLDRLFRLFPFALVESSFSTGDTA